MVDGTSLAIEPMAPFEVLVMRVIGMLFWLSLYGSVGLSERTDGRYPGGHISIITAEDPWDKYSKIFKKYTHVIEYRGRSRFTLTNPNPQVKEVEVYFKGTDADIKNADPLILGFLYHDTDKSKTGCNTDKCYYTWNHLTRYSNKNLVVGKEGVIKENDLVARLLEEIGNKIGRQNKLVINLDEQPDGSGGGGRTAYPESGFLISKHSNTKIMVTKKQEVTDVQVYDKYEHTVPGGVGINANELYVTYQNNSRYFKVASETYLRSGTVTGYFEKNTKELVLIVFTIVSQGTYWYSCNDFYNDLTKVDAGNATKPITVKTIISTSGGMKSVEASSSGSQLKDILPQEKSKLDKLITFEQGSGSSSSSNDNINTSPEQEVGTDTLSKLYTFKKVEMTPSTDTGSGGQSKVYSDHLFEKGEGAKVDSSATIPEQVLTGITTSSSGNNKYRCITVYYSSKGGSIYTYHNALLVQFDANDGSRKYIKRQDESGNKWADATDEIGAGAVDAARLTGIATAARIIVVSTSGVTQIRIETHRTGFYRGVSNTGGGKGVLYVKVAAEDPWDKYSKIFKKYTHTIEYPEGAGGVYVSSNYTIGVYYKGTYGSGQSTITLNTPEPQVKEVEVYFRGDADVDNTEPLVVGLVYAGDGKCGNTSSGTSKCYYTWTQLKTGGARRNGNYNKTITGVDSIKEQDLVARMLEEIGSKINREDKHVINLDELPGEGGGTTTYPASGNNKGRIKIIKQEVTGVDTGGGTRYDKYEHTIIGVGGNELYVTYQNNSRYFKTADGSHLGSATVTGYFEQGTKELVLIVFTIRAGSNHGAYVYRYSEFVSELRQVTAIDATSTSTVKEISISGGLESVGSGGSYNDSHLESILPQESKKLKQLIEFATGTGTGSNQNVKTSEEPNFGKDTFYQGYTFKKIEMTPNTSSGQSKVYSDHLFTKEGGAKIDTTATIPKEVLDSVTTREDTNKYRRITVYYSLKDGARENDCKALLAQFDAYDGSRKYIKRTGTDGNKWADATDEIGTGPVDAARLTGIARATGIIVVSTKSTTEIKIETNRSRYGYPEGHISNITRVDPWDSLSKIFKKYTHSIDYKGKSGVSYIPAEYKITFYYTTSNIGFVLTNPDPQVKEVEVYLRANDSSNNTPLILGFIYHSSDGGRTKCKTKKCYYTWSELKGSARSTKTYNGTITAESIKENDLVARLLEEIGRDISRENKLVIRLDERPPGEGRSSYPDSGYFTGNKQVNVAKNEVTDVVGMADGTKYEKYEHTLATGVAGIPPGGFQDLYVTYQGDIRYFKVAETRGQGYIAKVTGYFDYSSDSTGPVTTNSKRLVLIVFTIRAGSNHGAYKYPYSEFVSDFSHVRPDNATDAFKTIISSSGGLQRIGEGSYEDSALSVTLKEEKEKLDKLITFEQGSGSNQHIKTSQEDQVGTDTFNQGYTFMKVEMTPDTLSGGPWNVYNDHLFTNKLGSKIDTSATIPKEVLDSVTTREDTNKYRRITVYYSLKDGSSDTEHKALLVQFDSSDGSRKYIKRLDVGGSQWADASTVIGVGGVSPAVLTEIARDAGIIVVIDLAAVVGGPVAGIGAVGTGVGFAIYKYPQVFLSLIRR
ncbi:hypothetical protein MACJ_002402 [Theileria orientalis]|uniref:Uncharacterized protein n=1 Tax=Theileria orientalis TaxID=68886 RepID=A0A976M7K3_THEOR|nr:hypothetical protein MACJ_002402 [Theileria orientalis]